MRAIKHKPYYAVPAYLILARKTPKDAAERLGLCERTFNDKVSGYYDFSKLQAEILSDFVGVPQDKLFVVDNAS